MARLNSLFRIELACLLGGVLLGLLGCTGPAEPVPAREPVFFPPAPERPRLQFLTSFATSQDLGGAGPSALETFILGPAEAQQGISTPYGVALHDGKFYVCDVGQRTIHVIDWVRHTMTRLSDDSRLRNPVNLFITEDGEKYVADPAAGAVLVFDAQNRLVRILGKPSQIQPLDVAVRDRRCYVTDFASKQVVVLDARTGVELQRIGDEGTFQMISDLALGPDGHLFVTDKLRAQVTEFDAEGRQVQVIGRLGDGVADLARPKGIAVDSVGRIWLVDAASEVGKIYDDQGRLLLYFGLPGNDPGQMNLPAGLVLDDQHVDLFRSYAVPGARIEFLVIVTNQYGPNKVSVYGFGQFPTADRPLAPETEASSASDAHSVPMEEPTAPARRVEETNGMTSAGSQETPASGKSSSVSESSASMAPAATGPQADLADPEQRKRAQQHIADVYYRSLALYRAGRYAEARPGLVEVSRSGLIPPAMKESIDQAIAFIDRQLARQPGRP